MQESSSAQSAGRTRPLPRRRKRPLPCLGKLLLDGPAALRRESWQVMASDRIDIRHVARLARLALSEDEIGVFGPQLANLLSFVDELAQLDTANVAATAQVVPSRNVERADALRPQTMLSHEAALANAPQAQGGYFRVPRILAEDL